MSNPERNVFDIVFEAHINAANKAGDFNAEIAYRATLGMLRHQVAEGIIKPLPLQEIPLNVAQATNQKTYESAENILIGEESTLKLEQSSVVTPTELTGVDIIDNWITAPLPKEHGYNWETKQILEGDYRRIAMQALEALGLETRLRNGLARYSYSITFPAFSALTEKEILETPNLGKKAVTGIIQAQQKLAELIEQNNPSTTTE